MNEKTKKILLICYALLMFGVAIFYQFNKGNIKENNEEVVPPRIYSGKYKGHIELKYPQANAKAGQVRLEILKNIKTKKVKEEKKHRITECFDSKNRLVYKIDADLNTRVVTMSGNKFFKKVFELNVPEEEGYIYDENDKVITKLHRPNSWTYTVDKESDAGKYTYLEQGGIGVFVTNIKYFENNRRIETEEYINKVMSQLYARTESEFIDNKLVREKHFADQELKDSFIMYTTEKKYNDKGELIYKTVERKDKTNNYKSFTEMNFAKDEIVTKYYKGKNVFAIVTENLVGPVETIEETEMDRGKEIKKVYKNKVKAIVKRQKVGESVKIVDVIEYVPNEKFDYEKNKIYEPYYNTRYIIENNQIKYVIKQVRTSIYSYLYEPYFDKKLRTNSNYLYDSYFSIDLNNEYSYLGKLLYLDSILKVTNIKKDNLTGTEYKIKNKDNFSEVYQSIAYGEINNSFEGYIEKIRSLEIKDENIKYIIK